MLQQFANPARFNSLVANLIPWFAWLAGISIFVGLYFALLESPPDYQQGDTVRIMYIHVPSAWMALFVYALIAGASATGLIVKHPLAFLVARAAAPIGASFTFICLLTGSLWGKPIWGVWWVWDARLTSVLILFFLYLGFIALIRSFENPVQGEISAAILSLVGIINLPIIKFSVDWWNTLHQPSSVVKLAGPAIHSSMLLPLLIMALGFFFYFCVVLLLRMKTLVIMRRTRGIIISQLNQDQK